MASDLVIYGMRGSPFVRNVQVLLAEKGVEYELETASPFPAPHSLKEISPAKRIPVLRDRSIGTEGVAGTLPDSSAIRAYLEGKQPEPSLYPRGAFDYGRALRFEEYADSDLAARIGLGLFRPTVMAPLFGKEPDVERARKTLREDLPPMFDYLEGSIHGRPFLLGESLSIADVGVATQFVNLHHAGATLDAARWPSLATYVERLHARPSFADCIAAERQLLPPSGAAL